MSTRILAIDPGVTTGWCSHEMGTTKFTRGELGPDEHHLDLWELLKRQVPHTVVTERFEYRILKDQDGNVMPGVRLESREYIGVIKLWCQMGYSRYVPQTSSQAKAFWDDKKLKALGMYQAPSGRQHMNDATRHLLFYLTLNKNGPKDDTILTRLRTMLAPTRPTQTGT
jgi:hypothetical protein